jgi:BirA family biotin operon repressor/biotin-[acetyl-CoA-carboxylase] ligase
MTLPIFLEFETVSSTNDVALDLARNGAPEGTAVIARSQTAGRGRRGRRWIDEPGQSVLVSIVLRPNLVPDRVYELSFVASLAVAQYLESEFNLGAAIKWPNDVIVNTKKICGILVETEAARAGAAAVVGIGVNVNQTSFSPEISDIATSIALETGSKQDVRRVTEKVSIALLECYDVYKSKGFESTLSRWRGYMYGVGRDAEVRTGNNVICGKVLGVNEQGALLLGDASCVHEVSWADDISLRSASNYEIGGNDG